MSVDEPERQMRERSQGRSERSRKREGQGRHEGGGRPDRAEASTLVARDAGTRRLSDPMAMRALAHPTRIALVEALVREGPLTATEAAAILDDSPGNISWHFGILSKYGYIEEVASKGRRRPWRLTAVSANFSTGADEGEEVTAAADALEATVSTLAMQSHQEWAARRHLFEASWRAAGYLTDTITYLTADELDALGDEVTALLHRYAERTMDKSLRPPGSKPVRLTAWGHPLPPMPSGS